MVDERERRVRVVLREALAEPPGAAGLHTSRPFGDGVLPAVTGDDLDDDLGRVVAGLRAGVLIAATRLDDHPSVDATIERLLHPRAEDRRRVTFPAMLTDDPGALRVFTAAALAAVSGRPDAEALAERAATLLQPWRGGLTDRRIARLRASVRHRSGPGDGLTSGT